MTFLPIVERELRAGARRKSVRRVRLVVAALSLVIGLYQVTFGSYLLSARSGKSGFLMMTGFAFLLCLLAGAFVTADCLSEEKREGTLGLLFLTDLKSYDIVLGKLSSQFISLGYALMAVIPAAALPLLFGGVTGSELFRVSLALMNLLFFSLSTGVLASALCRRAGSAIAVSICVLFLFCVVLPLFQAAVNAGSTTPSVFGVGILSPTHAYAHAMETSFVRSPANYWLALGVSHLVGWVFILLASRVLPNSWQDDGEAVIPPLQPVPLPGPTVATNEPVQPHFADLAGNTYWRPTNRRPKLLDQNPWLWLIGEREGAGHMLIVMTCIWGVIVLTAALAGSELSMVVYFIGTWLYLFIAKILFAYQATRFFVETRLAGAFEMLVATPLEIDGLEGLVSSQWIALKRTFSSPLLAAGGVTIVFLVIVMAVGSTTRSDNQIPPESLPAIAIYGAFAFLIEFLDFMAIGNLSMWLGLTMRKPHLAPGATILFLLLLPLLGIWCAGFIGIVLDLIIIMAFGDKLRHDLRNVLTGERDISKTSRGNTN